MPIEKPHPKWRLLLKTHHQCKTDVKIKDEIFSSFSCFSSFLIESGATPTSPSRLPHTRWIEFCFPKQFRISPLMPSRSSLCIYSFRIATVSAFILAFGSSPKASTTALSSTKSATFSAARLRACSSSAVLRAFQRMSVASFLDLPFSSAYASVNSRCSFTASSSTAEASALL